MDGLTIIILLQSRLPHLYSKRRSWDTKGTQGGPATVRVRGEGTRYSAIQLNADETHIEVGGPRPIQVNHVLQLTDVVHELRLYGCSM